MPAAPDRRLAGHQRLDPHPLRHPAQKDRWLRWIGTGERRIVFAITEPDAGSNSHRISTTAKRVDGGYVLSGTSPASRTPTRSWSWPALRSTSAPGKGKVSLLIVDADASGLTRQHIPTALSAAEKQWMLFSDGVDVEAARLIGAEHQGLKLVFDGLNPERIAAAVMCTGIARDAIDKASRYANERAVWEASRSAPTRGSRTARRGQDPARVPPGS